MFIQIGSNDGKRLDPLHDVLVRGRWRGVMVEPVPYVFKRLKANYGAYQHRFSLENVAIGELDGEQSFYHLREAGDYASQGLPFWYDQLGSFRKDVLLKHEELIPDICTRITETVVPCVRFETLCARHKLEQIDLLHMDTEGYDFTLLQTIDLEKYRPFVLIYEHFHLSDAEKRACRQLLAARGYETLEEGMDTWCLRVGDGTRRDQRLLRLWGRLRAGASAIS